MKRSYRYAGILAALFLTAPALADNPQTGGTIVLNTYSKVLPKLVGDNLGPTKTDSSGNTVPRIGRCTGVGQFNPMLKVDDSPSAAADTSKVTFLITTTRSANTPNRNGNNAYFQGAFATVDLTAAGVQDAAMNYVELPTLDGERTWQKPNIISTDKHIVIIGAGEDNGQNNNPQVVAFVYDKQTLQPVKVLNSNRQDSTKKPTNLIELSGKNDNQQYGMHSLVRVPGTSNKFTGGVQRNNQNAYVLGFTVDETPADGVNLKVDYLTRVIQNAQHCRPQVVTNAAEPNVGYLTSVEANTQPANVGVQALKFDLTTGRVISRTYVAKSDPKNNKYAVQPEIADLGDKIAVSYQMSEKTRRGNGPGDGQGHTGGSNFSYVQVLDKATLSPVGPAMAGVGAYSRHAGAASTMWGPVGQEVPAFASLAGSAEGTGHGYIQIVPWDTTANTLGTKDPGKLYQLATYTDVAGVASRGDRNPQDQARSFLYGVGNVRNPGFGGGTSAFMPEVKTFIASAVQGFTNATTAKIGARESIYLSLVPATWVNQPTTPGTPTPTPGTNPDGTGPLPRTTAPGTNPAANTPAPPSVIPQDNGPQGPTSSQGGGVYGPGNGNEVNAGCSVSTTGAAGTSGFAGLLIGLGALLTIRRNRKEAK